jgi:hypothetical protein
VDREILLVRVARVQNVLGLTRKTRQCKAQQSSRRGEQTFFTLGSTYGLPSPSRYAPTPKLILRESLSALKASVTPGSDAFRQAGHQKAPRAQRTENGVRRARGHGLPGRHTAQSRCECAVSETVASDGKHGGCVEVGEERERESNVPPHTPGSPAVWASKVLAKHKSGHRCAVHDPNFSLAVHEMYVSN